MENSEQELKIENIVKKIEEDTVKLLDCHLGSKQTLEIAKNIITTRFSSVSKEFDSEIKINVFQDEDDPEKINITFGNFFTFLLWHGVFVPPKELIGKKEYKTDQVIFVEMESGEYGYRPIVPLVSVDIEISLEDFNKGKDI